MARLLFIMWPPSRPIRVAVFPLRWALQTSEKEEIADHQHYDKGNEFCQTIIREGHFKAVWVLPGQSVNQVNLLHAKLDGIFELGPTVAVCDKELEEEHELIQFVEEKTTFLNLPLHRADPFLFCRYRCGFYPLDLLSGPVGQDGCQLAHKIEKAGRCDWKTEQKHC